MKMQVSASNIAYIDAANLHRSMQGLRWNLDYRRFRRWLTDKYRIKTAYVFIGRIPRHAKLYTHLEACGFTLMYKEVVYQKGGKPKGNCDTDLIMKAMDDAYEGMLSKAPLVSSDGDYAPLVTKLQSRGQFLAILSPAPAKKCSVLLKRTNVAIAYITDQRGLLELK